MFQIFFGNVCSANLGQSPAKQVVIYAGLPTSVICSVVNKLCSSSTKSIILATQALQTGAQDVVLAGGMESMSNVPFYLKRGEIPYGGISLIDGLLFDAFTDVYTKYHAGNCAEYIAKKYEISREEQDDYAILSYKRTEKAYESNVFANELVSVSLPQKHGLPPLLVTEDEEYKRCDFEKMRKLPPVFQKSNGTVTAGNASTLSDGAAALLLMTAQAAQRLNVTPIAKVIGYAEVEINTIDFPEAPSVAIPKLLQVTGVNKEDVALWEINEAFSVVAIVNQRLLDIDIEKYNIHGGAVSIGHPLGMSGARLVAHLVHSLKKGEKGVAATCNGAGGASAIMIEKIK